MQLSSPQGVTDALAGTGRLLGVYSILLSAGILLS